MRGWVGVWRGLALGCSTLASLVGSMAVITDPGDPLLWGLLLVALAVLAGTMGQWLTEDDALRERWPAEGRGSHDHRS